MKKFKLDAHFFIKILKVILDFQNLIKCRNQIAKKCISFKICPRQCLRLPRGPVFLESERTREFWKWPQFSSGPTMEIVRALNRASVNFNCEFVIQEEKKPILMQLWKVSPPLISLNEFCLILKLHVKSFWFSIPKF